MKVLLAHVENNGANPERSLRLPSPIESQGGDGGDVDVRLHFAGNGEGA
jgi:hypothetical protein